MKDPYGTNQELIKEISVLKQRIQELEQLESAHKQVEEALRENEAHLKVALTPIDMAVFNQDLDLRYTWMYRPQLEYTTEQVVDKTDAELLPPDAARQATEIKRRVLENGTGARSEIEIVLEDRRLCYDLVVEPLRNAAGQVVGITGASLDITERKRIEEEYRNSEVRYRALFEQSPNGILLIDTETGKTIEANETAYKQLGYTREEFAALRISDYEALEKPEETAKHMQKIIYDGNDDFESLHRTKSGDIRNVHVWAKTVYLNNRSLFYAIFQDITERKQIEELLHEKTRYIEAFFNHTINPVVLLDRDFNFIRVNESYARATQRKVSEFPGRNHFDLYPSEAKVIFEDVVSTRAPFQTVARPFVFPDHPEWGKTYWDWWLVPILDSSGEIDFLVFSLTDVTERKQAEDKVIKYQENLRSLVQQVSLIEEQERQRISSDLHDNISQSLALSKIKVEALRHSDSARDIAGELGDIQELIEQSLQYTRSLTSELSPSILFELGFEKAVEWLCDRTREKHHILVELISDGKLDVKLADMKIEMSLLLFKTVRELLINIVKHAGAKNVLVSLRRENEDAIRINVEDDGGGFDISKIGHYEDGAESFGLFNVRERVNYLGGTFDIESYPEHGTRVTIVVPMKNINNKGTAK